MIDYTIGDKVVCIDGDPVDFRKVLKYRLKDFHLPVVGAIYTVRDMAPGEMFTNETCDHDGPGVLLAEITAGTDDEGDEWWYSADSFRKALPAELAQSTTRQQQPVPA